MQTCEKRLWYIWGIPGLAIKGKCSILYKRRQERKAHCNQVLPMSGQGKHCPKEHASSFTITVTSITIQFVYKRYSPSGRQARSQKRAEYGERLWIFSNSLETLRENLKQSNMRDTGSYNPICFFRTSQISLWRNILYWDKSGRKKVERSLWYSHIC